MLTSVINCNYGKHILNIVAISTTAQLYKHPTTAPSTKETPNYSVTAYHLGILLKTFLRLLLTKRANGRVTRWNVTNALPAFEEGRSTIF